MVTHKAIIDFVAWLITDLFTMQLFIGLASLTPYLVYVSLLLFSTL